MAEAKPAKKTATRRTAKKTAPAEPLEPTEATLYRSGIELGQKYRHSRYDGLEGYAVSLTFMETSCEMVTLEYQRLGTGQVVTQLVEAEQLIHVESGRPVSGRGLKGNLAAVYPAPGLPGW